MTTNGHMGAAHLRVWCSLPSLPPPPGCLTWKTQCNHTPAATNDFSLFEIVREGWRHLLSPFPTGVRKEALYNSWKQSGSTFTQPMIPRLFLSDVVTREMGQVVQVILNAPNRNLIFFLEGGTFGKWAHFFSSCYRSKAWWQVTSHSQGHIFHDSFSQEVEVKKKFGESTITVCRWWN